MLHAPRDPLYEAGIRPVEPHEPGHGTLINVHVARHPGQSLGHLLSQPGEKENDLLKQQSAIQEELTELAKREAVVYRISFEKEKELTDRALKLAEVEIPKTNRGLQGLLGLPVFGLGFLAGAYKWPHMPNIP